MEQHRPRAYTSIHERRLELIERSIVGGRRGDREPIAPKDDELIVIDSVAGLIAGLVGVAIHGVSAAFPMLLAAFVAPLWFLVAQYAVWAVTLRLAIRMRERHPWVTLAIPLVTIAAWVLALDVGMQRLGWSPLRF
jgi:hypothetical protein